MNTCVYSLNKKRIAFQQSDRVYNHLHALIYASIAQYKVRWIFQFRDGGYSDLLAQTNVIKLYYET